MKKTILLLFIFLCICESIVKGPVAALENTIETIPEIIAPSAILIDAETGDILYEKNPHTPMYPASTTKIMTAILAIENLDLKDIVVIDKDASCTGGSRICALEGEIFTVEQLLYALLLPSANDAAVALAKHISGDIKSFAELMNHRAKELGAKNTQFVNPNGLPDENHITTAHDLAMIAKYAITLPKFSEIVKTAHYQIPPTNKQPETRYLRNSNRFLWGEKGNRNKINYKNQQINIKYNIIDGIKTGYTNQAQQCLVSSAKKNGHRLISVVLRSDGKNVYVDSRTLIDYGFEHFKFIKLTDANEKIKTVFVKHGSEKTLNLVTQNQLYKSIPKHDKLHKIHTTLKINQKITAPILKGQPLGKIIYTSDDQYLGEVDLIAEKSIPKKEGWFSFLDSRPFLKMFFLFLVCLPICFFLTCTLIIMIQTKNFKRNSFKKIANKTSKPFLHR